MSAGYIEPVIGLRFIIVIGYIFILGGYFLCYYFINFYLILVAFCLMGLGNTLCYFSVIENSWKYYRNKKGTITGLILSFYGGSSFLFTSLGDFLINPHNIDADKNGYYDERVTKNVKPFLFIFLIILAGLALISLVLIFPYPKDTQNPTDEEENEESGKSTKIDEGKAESTLSSILGEKPLKTALKSRKFVCIFIMMCCISCK